MPHVGATFAGIAANVTPLADQISGSAAIGKRLDAKIELFAGGGGVSARTYRY